MIDYSITIAACLIGGAWRYAFGHAWGDGNFITKHARSILEICGAVIGGLIVWANDGNPIAVALGIGCTLGYFAIGNGTVLRGPTDPAWPYARALLLKYQAPAIAANLALWLLDYHAGIALAGSVAALGYFAFWKPDLNGLDAWNEKAEALSGAAWFGLLSITL